MAYEVITSADKDVRDRLFEDLRKNGNELERKVVKFSGSEPILDADGNHVSIAYDNSKKPKKGRFQIRPQYRSTWYVAYPQS